MSNRNPATETITTEGFNQQLSAIVDRVGRRETRVVVERDGAPVAALVSPEDLERLEQIDKQLAARRALLEEARAPFKSIPPDEIEREVAKALAEVRAEMRAEKAETVPQ